MINGLRGEAVPVVRFTDKPTAPKSYILFLTLLYFLVVFSHHNS